MMNHQLIRLLCASTCLVKKTRPNLKNWKCSMPYCEEFQQRLIHMKNCTDRSKCNVPLCLVSRHLLAHWLRCRRPLCKLCGPVIKVLSAWRSHYDTLYQQANSENPDYQGIARSVGGLNDIVDSEDFTTMLKLVQGISIHEDENFHSVFEALNNLKISSESGSDCSTVDTEIDSLLHKMKDVSIGDDELNAMLRMMEGARIDDPTGHSIQ